MKLNWNPPCHYDMHVWDYYITQTRRSCEMTSQISRDPFSRTTLMRSTEYVPIKSCYWCGGKRKDGSLFRYYTESDGGRTSEHPGLFCCKVCHDSYNDRRW